MKIIFVISIWTLAGPLFCAERFYASGPTAEKKLSLTFDDGPGPMTPQFLDLLDRYNAKATFFLLAELVPYRAELTNDIVRRGHEVGSHSVRHENYHALMKKLMRKYAETTSHRPQALEETKSLLLIDMQNSRATIERSIGRKIFLYRMPHGIDAPWVRETAAEAGFTLVNWTYGSDWTPDPLETQIEAYKKAIKPGAILLLHDGGTKRDKSLAITEAILKTAQQEGFQIVPVGTLLKIP